MTRLGVHREIIILALGLTLLRLLAARGIHLTEDEAYYRLWAAQLQLGYYDHPPMIAWWIGSGIALLGDHALGVRLLPTLATGVATWLVSDLARQLGAQPATQLRAAFWYNATLTIGVGGMLATPDAPATFFWVLTIWALARTSGARPGLWWAVAGVTAGLATISKYSSLFLAPGAFLWLCLSPGGMARLKTPWPWVAAVLAGAIFATNVAWNAQHGWITFAKQFGRVAPSSFSPTHLIELLLTQFILLTPMISLYAIKGVRQAWTERQNPQAIQLLLPVATTVPFAAYLMLHSLHDRVQGHWPVPIFAALVICAVVAADRGISSLAVRRLQALAVALCLGLSAAALGYLSLPISPVFGAVDPMRPLRGWPGFAGAIEQTRQQAGAGWIGTVSYGTFAQLSAEKPTRVPMLQINERARYTGLPSVSPDFQQPGLVVDLARRLEAKDLLRCFSQVTLARDLTRGALGLAPGTRYQAFVVAEPRVDVLRDGCPEDPAKRRRR